MNLAPQEKAKQLISVFGKKLAIKAAEEVIYQWEYVTTYLGNFNPHLEYWYNVKQELEKM